MRPGGKEGKIVGVIMENSKVLRFDLGKAMELGISLVILSPLVFITGCGGGSSKSSSGAVSSIVQLSGSNGDMSKYLGRWVSECGTKIGPWPNGTAYPTLDGGINTFELTTISGVRVEGTLTAVTYAGNTSCLGWGTQSVATPIFLQYASSVSITTPAGQKVDFAGSADRIDYGAISGVMAAPYNFAFRSNFGQFQLTSASNAFSTTNVIYTKQ